MKAAMFICGALFAISCSSSGGGDPSMYLTGSEELAVQSADGSFHCDNAKKVLICHIPPGNPDNAHEICVGQPAVAPHQRLHGDYVGECAAPDAGTPPAEDAAPVPAPEPGPDGGPVN